MSQLNRELTGGSPQTTLRALQDPILRLPRVWVAADVLYYQELGALKRQKDADLSFQEVNSNVKCMSRCLCVRMLIPLRLPFFSVEQRDRSQSIS